MAQLSNVDLLNYLRVGASTEFNDRIPTVTKQNLSEVANAIETMPIIKNEFINTLVDKIIKTVFITKTYENDLRIFHKGSLEAYGKTIEMIFVDMIKGKDFSDKFGGNDVSNLISKRPTENVKPLYISENVQLRYDVSISEVELSRAMTSEFGLHTLLNAKLESQITSNQFDEYLIMKNLLVNSKALEVETQEVTDSITAKNLLKQIKTFTKLFKYPSTKYNSQAVTTCTNIDDIVIVLDALTSTNLDIEYLASVFNTDIAKIKGRVIEVDSFGDDKTVCMIMDKDYIQFFNTLDKQVSFYNPAELYTNVFLHKWYNANLCHFCNAVKFVLPSKQKSK